MNGWTTVGQLASLLGALGVGGVIAGGIASARDQRAARATALEALGEVEELRWADTPDDEFFRSQQRMRTAALLARLPRGPVEDYLDAAITARRYTVARVEEFAEVQIALPPGGSLSSSLSNAVVGQAAILADILWSPRWLRAVRRPVEKRHAARVARAAIPQRGQAAD
jgi:hypothetical protein